MWLSSRSTSSSVLFVSVLLAAAVPAIASAPEETYAYTVPPVTLVDKSGQAVKLTDALSFKGAIFLQFIFTTCGTVCPIMTATLEGMQSRLGVEAKSVRMVSISIDPETDTPQRLTSYAKEFNAGPQWLFLTGTEAASVAAQKAFDVYWRDKMRHQPVIFLRPAGAETWRRLEGLTNVSELMDIYRRLSPPGQRVYREGVLPDGALLRARLGDGIELAGARAACSNCHRNSGMGSTEGGVLGPPVTAEALFQPTRPRQADLFGKLYQEGQPAPFRAGIAGAMPRPAYEDRSLMNLLRNGIDPTGRKLDAAMPRYQLSDDDAAQLIAYLRSLSGTGAPGVDKSSIHFATVVSDGEDPAVVQSMLSVMNAWVARRNLQTRNELSKQGRNAWYMDDFYRAYREWKLHVWKLEGPRESWAAQLDAFRREQPVFALLGGAITGSWKPVGDFCARTGTPCLFPETLLPDNSPGSDHTIYLSKGLAGEAAALAAYLRSQGITSVTQIYRLTEPADAFRTSFHGAIQDIPIAPGRALTSSFWKGLGKTQALIVWLGDADLTALESDAPVYLSASLTTPSLHPNAFLTWPYALPTEPSQDASRVRGWLLSRGVPKGVERVEFDSWYTMDLLDYSLAQMVENFSQDYLIETIENEAETSLNPGVFPRLALGPGQRFASKGAYIVSANGLKPESGWIAP
jgi:cytochrome oxidase Cu insertion factor (SCO1/SenC/PrrC family)